MAKDKTIPLAPIEVLSFPQPPLKKSEDYLRAYNGYTYSAVTAISQEVASIELHLFRRKFTPKGPQIDEIFEHPAISLLFYTNRLMTHYDLLEATQTYLDLVGEAFWVILREGDEPAELWPVRPDWMKVIPSATNVVDAYVYAPGGMGRDLVRFEPKDVIHFKYFNPINPYRGKGSVQAGSMAIDIHTFAQEYNRNFFFNSAIPGMVFTTDQKVAPEVIKRFMESWQAKFGGKGNSNKVAFLSGGFKPEKISFTAKDMDFKELQSMMRDDIMAVFKVPKTILGLTDDVNRANAEATTRSFMERVVTPRMKKLVAHLNEFYLPNWEDDLFFDFDDPAPEDTELKLKIYESGLNFGWLTTNEVREQENLPPVEGGDTIYISFGKVPLGGEPVIPNQAPSERGIGILSRLIGRKEQSRIIALPVKKKVKKERKFIMPIPPIKLAELRDKKLKGEIKSDLIKLIGNLMKNGGINRKRKVKSTWSDEKRDSHWLKLVAKTDVQEQKLKDLVIPLFNDQENEVKGNIDNLKLYAPDRKKGKESSFLFNITTEVAKWVSVIIPYERDVMLDKGAEVLEFLGTGGQLDPYTDSAVDFIRRQGTERMQGINETTRDALKKELSEGIQKGEDVDTLKARVGKVYSEARGPRAEMIARTETLKATNFATVEAYTQSGIVKRKEWLTAVDERVSEGCRLMDGQMVDQDKNFSSSYYGLDLEYPPLHPNCRCTIIPVL